VSAGNGILFSGVSIILVVACSLAASFSWPNVLINSDNIIFFGGTFTQVGSIVGRVRLAV